MPSSYKHTLKKRQIKKGKKMVKKLTMSYAVLLTAILNKPGHLCL